MAHDLGKGWLGNFFEDFELGKEQVCAPPRVIGAPESAIHIATTNDRQARFCGGEGRMHPLAVFHTVIGQTVRNISLNSPANLGYSKMIWHAPVFAGDEITTTIKIVGLKENSNGKTGNCFVETTGRNQSGEVVLQYTRWVMVRKRDHDTPTAYLENPVTPTLASQVEVTELPAWSGDLSRSETTGGAYFFEDYQVGERIFHHDGMTVNHTDHMQYTRLWQNSAKVHFDEILTDGKPLVYGGFPFSVAYAQSLNGLENRSGMVAMNSGAHANPCYSGTTIYSFTEVLETHDLGDKPYGALRLRLVGIKDLNPADHKDFDIGEDNGKGRIKYDPRVLLCMDIWELMPKRPA